MYKFYILLALVQLLFFSSCEKKQKIVKQTGSPFVQPIVIAASNPIVNLLDTCAKPVVVAIPATGSTAFTLQTKEGTQHIELFAPSIHPLGNGEVGGYTFMQNYNTEQGLALSSISCAYMDNTGNLWFGTAGGGISRYDGKSFTNYTTANGLAGNLIKSITQDKMGNMWFGTNGNGVSKYDGNCFTTYTTVDGLAHNIVKNILADRNGNLWFATEGGISKLHIDKVGEIETSRFTNFTKEQGLLSNTILCIAEDKSGDIWFGTSQGVSKYISSKNHKLQDSLFINYTVEEGLINNSISCMTIDHDGNLWVGSSGGICIHKPSESKKPFVQFPISKELSNRAISIYAITEDDGRNLWIATGIGVYRYSNKEKNRSDVKDVTLFTAAEGLSSDVIISITKDKSGNLWFGNNGGGVNKYTNSSFTSFNTNRGLVSNKVWSIKEDESGNNWFGTNQGISKYDGKAFTNFSAKWISANVRSVLKDKNGSLWFGNSYGITKYDGKSFINYGTAQGFMNSSVLSSLEDRNGNLWFGTYGSGVSKFDGKSFTNYTTAQGLANNTIKCIAEDKDGNIWLGTNGNGVSMYDGKSFTNYTTAQGLANNSILSMLVDKKGNLWIGTFGGGISKYNPSALQTNTHTYFTNYTTADGLANDVIYAIVEDKANSILWFGTNFGLSGLIQDSVGDEQHLPAFENYGNYNGSPIRDVNTGAMFIDSKGIMWIGTGEGLERFDYKAIRKKSSEPPNVLIQSIRIQEEKVCWHNLKTHAQKNSAGNYYNNKQDSLALLNEEVSNFGHALSDLQRNAMYDFYHDIKFDSITRFYALPTNLELPFNHNNVTFDFAAIEPGTPQLVRYQYFLDGYDKDWNAVTSSSTAVFGNIQEGSYTFKLKAQSPDGIWCEPISFSFKVLPPWYRTWWMYLSYTLAILSAIVLFFRWRTASLRNEKVLLEKTVQERTAEVVEQKELIEKKNELVEEKQKEILDSINYAKRIQYTLLAQDDVLQQNLKHFFILFQPKDIVSGDFYWATSVIDKKNEGSENKSTRFYFAICEFIKNIFFERSYYRKKY
jgi:ligand-binding sensor domain-containing protein